MSARGRSPRTTETADKARSTASQESSLLHAERLKQLYTALLRCRVSEKLSRGREAILAAVSLELGSDDYLLPQRAGALVARLKDSATASGNESGGNQSLRDISELTLATGMALGLRTAQRTGMVVTLARGSAEADREFSRLLAFASGSKLPVIYVLESALALQTRSKTAKPPLPVIIVDGSDTVAILRVIQECSRRARQGHGPALIRCTRTTTDPLKFMREYLRDRNLWSEEWQRTMESEIRSATGKSKKLGA